MSGILRTLLLCLCLTLALEAGAAWVLRLRGGWNYLLVILVNFLTNPPAALLSLMVPFTGCGRIFFVVLLEAAVVVTEGLVYNHFGVRIRRSFLFSLVLNAASLGIGSAVLWLMGAA